jgi:hypothetical protein
MTVPAARFGVCTMRVEVQPEHLLITISANLYLAPGARRAITRPPKSYASIQEALDATQEFLESFGVWHQPGRATR